MAHQFRTYSASNLIKMGYTVGNSNTSKLYYVLGVDWASAKPDDIYSFDPYIFVNYEMLRTNLRMWVPRYSFGAISRIVKREELYISLCNLQSLAQKNWGSENCPLRTIQKDYEYGGPCSRIYRSKDSN